VISKGREKKGIPQGQQGKAGRPRGMSMGNKQKKGDKNRGGVQADARAKVREKILRGQKARE